MAVVLVVEIFTNILFCYIFEQFSSHPHKHSLTNTKCSSNRKSVNIFKNDKKKKCESLKKEQLKALNH